MKIIISLNLLMWYCHAIAQINAPAWQYANSGNGNGLDEVRKVCADKNGNYYITGVFRGSTITFGTFTLTNAGGTAGTSDIFIAKYNSTGNIVWAIRDGGAWSEYVYGLCVDGNDNLVITGSYTGSLTILGTSSYTNYNFNFTDFLVAKYDSGGNILWSRTAGGQYDERGNDVSCDKNGNIYITGTHGNMNLHFGTVTLPGVIGGRRVFLLKYDPNGNALWAYGGTDPSYEDGYSNAIVTDSSGISYVTGYYNSQRYTFGSDTLTNNNQNSSSATSDVFVVKYDASGTVLWAKSAGGISSDAGRDIGIDNNSNVYIVGDLLSPVSYFGNVSLTNPVGVPAGGSNYNAFVTKYSSSGNVVWASNLNGTRAIARGIYVNGNGDAYVTGGFKDSIMAIANGTLVNAGVSGTYDVFVTKYNTTGNVVWAKAAGGSSTDIAYGITLDVTWNIFVTGIYNSPTISFGNNTLPGADSIDVFVSRLGNDNYLSISEIEIRGSIQAFPVPCQNFLNLRSDRLIGSISMSNTLGQVVYEKDNMVRSNEIEIDLHTQPEGTYFIRVSFDNNFVWTKFVLSR